MISMLVREIREMLRELLVGVCVRSYGSRDCSRLSRLREMLRQLLVGVCVSESFGLSILRLLETQLMIGKV